MRLVTIPTREAIESNPLRIIDENHTHYIFNDVEGYNIIPIHPRGFYGETLEVIKEYEKYLVIRTLYGTCVSFPKSLLVSKISGWRVGYVR